MDPLVVVFGLGVGVLVGLTGIGGGSLMTPLLILVVGTQPVVAIGTDLAYGAITKTVGGWRHYRQGTVDMRLSTWLALGSVPGSLIGVLLVERLHRAYGNEFDGVLLVCIAGALLVVAVAILARALFMPRSIAREVHTADLTRRRRIAAVVIGAVLGLVLGFTSLGSGALVGLVLILFFRLTPHRVVGTDVFHAAILLWAAAAAHLVAGNVDFALAGNILVGSVPAVWLGSHLSVRVPTATLRTILAIVLLGSGLGLLAKAGVGVPGAVLGAFPVVVAVLVGVMTLRDRRRAAERAAEAPERRSATADEPAPVTAH